MALDFPSSPTNGQTFVSGNRTWTYNTTTSSWEASSVATSKTANYVYAAPNGSAGIPDFRALVAADIPTLNQNTTGTAATITGVYSGTITSGQITTGLGFTPYNATNPSGYITGSGSITGSAGSLTGFTNSNSASPISGPDNLTNNGLAYVTGMSLLGQTDGALYTQAHSTNWIHQIYGDYRTGQIALRAKNNGTWQAWRINLDSSNYTSYAMPSGSSATNSVDVRAPLFYDSDDTAFYVNPNSTSRFSSVQTVGITGIHTAGSTGIDMATNDNYVSMRVIRNSAASSSNDGMYIGYGNSNSGLTRLYGGGATGGAFEKRSDHSFEPGSFRAPIFYDSANTAFYVDAASTSNIGSTYVNGYFQVQYNSGNQFAGMGIRNNYGSASAQSTGFIDFTNENGIQKASVFGRMATDGAGYLEFLSTAAGVSRSTDTRTTTAYAYSNQWSFQTSAGISTNIVYDRDNTAYYVDPASTSVLNKLNVSGRQMGSSATLDLSALDVGTWYPVTIPIAIGRRTTLRIENALNSNVPSWSTHPSGFSVYIEWVNNGFGWGTIGAERFVNNWRESFTSIQIVGGLTQLGQSSTEVIWLRGGGTYFFSADADVTPTIRTTSYTINGQTVEPRTSIFNNPREAANGRMSVGSLQTNEASLFRANLAFPDTTNVGLMNASSDAWVWLDDAYGNFYIKNVNGGFYSDFTAYVFRSAASAEWAYMDSSMLRHNSSLRAPIFYDTNDTTYYVDPNSTSVMNAIQPWGEVGMRRGDTATLLRSYNTSASQATQFYVNHNLAAVEIGNARGIVYAGGTYWQVANSTRSPIFYDSDNTAFMADFASASADAVYTNGGYSISSGDGKGFRFWNDDSYKIYMSSTASATWGGRASGETTSDYNMYFRMSGGTNRGFVFRNGTTNVAGIDSTGRIFTSGGRIYLNDATNNFIIAQAGTSSALYMEARGGGFRVRNAATGDSWFTALDGTCTATTDFRAPIFYDTNNTGYYVDPNSTSTLYRTNGDGFAASQFLCGMTNYGDQVSASTWYGIGRSNVVGWTAGGMVQVAGYTGTRLRGAYSIIDIDGAVGGDLINFTTATARFTGDVRSTIFYDVSNTAYYVDPNAGSNVFGEFKVNQNGAAGIQLISTTGTQSLWIRTGYDNAPTPSVSATNVQFQSSGSSGGSFTFWSGNTLALTITGDYAQGAGSLRAPIFYDSNNTGFYIDPASTSILNSFECGNFTSSDNAPTWTNAGLQYVEHLSSHLAYYKKAGIYHYYWRRSDTGYAGGANDTTMMQLTDSGSLSVIADMRAPIYYDSNDTSRYLDPNNAGLALRTSGYWIADTTAWGGDVNGKIQYHDNSWYFSAANQWVFRASSGAEPFRVTQAGLAIASSDMRAPLFYDNNDTGYYLNPNSDSNLYRTSTYLSPKDNNGNWNTAFTNTPAFSKAYHADVSSGGPAGSWWFYESMRHSNASNYWGTQIAWGWEDNANRMFQRNVTGGSFGGWVEYLNTSDRTYNGNLYMTGSIRSTSSDIRAPIFYDQDNTGYYVNAAGTSYINALNIGPTAAGSSYLNINGYNAYGGTGYHGFLTVSNTYGSATNPNQYWRINGAGGFEIVNSPYNAVLFTFTQGGDFTAAGNVTAYSDRKLKANFEPIENALSKVIQLNGVTFTRIDKEDLSKRYGGLIAQDVEAVLPEAVQINETISYGEVKSVDYNATIALLVEAIKEQQSHITKLEEKLNKLLGE